MNFFKDLTKKSKGNIYVIAEACDNHMGSLDIAKALVNAAVYSGADAVKFQHHLADEEMLRESPMSDNFSEPLYDFLIRNSLSLEQHYELADYCHQNKISYLCTPFSAKAAYEIAEIVPFFKIGSGEFQDRWFLDQLKELNKPILLSSGMCSLEEVNDNIKYLKRNKFDFAIMNCLSEYPPNYNDMNLNVITLLKEKFSDIEIGHSDHSPEIYTSVVAASLGASIIEKHITISSFVDGPDKSVSVEPFEFKKLVNSLRYIKSTLGKNKVVNKKEKAIRKWAYRSVVARHELPIGHIVKRKDICTKRPGTGIESKKYKEIIGKKIKKKVFSNQIINWSNLDD